MRSGYDHRHHAGNHGDVFKHVALLALLAAVRPRLVVETHAGRGVYALPPDGAWTRGVGRLLDRWPDGAPTGSAAVDRYLARVRAHVARGMLPGSPRLALDVLGADARLVLHERDAEAAATLRAVTDDPRVRVVTGDGWTAAPPTDGGVLVVDPPYDDPADWDRAAGISGDGTLLWYPITGDPRRDALLAALRARGVRFEALELGVAAPGSGGLAGSGVLLVGAPAGVAAELALAVPVLGDALAPGRWWSRREHPR